MARTERRVGGYDLLDVIGGGDSAVVYLAYQRDLRRRAALKELLTRRVADTSFAERFVEELRHAGTMSHPSIVTVYEVFEHDGIPYIAMEYLPRGSLRRYVGRLSVAQTVGVLESVLAGLAHGERQGVVHRDLKPENLLIAVDGRVKIADFGVTRASNVAATRAAVAATASTIGTAAYMAPEQALGEELTSASDLYSLGIVTWEMLAGELPFENIGALEEVIDRQVNEPVPRVTEVAPGIDERLGGWLDRMLAERPADRFRHAESAWEALEAVVIDVLGPSWRDEARAIGRPGRDYRPPQTRRPARIEKPSRRRALTERRPAGIEKPARRRALTERRPAGIEKPARRRAVIAALLIATTLAGGAGALVGAMTGRSSSDHAGRITKTANPTATLDRELAGVLGSLATARDDGWDRLRAAKTARQQVDAAKAVAAAYQIAAGRITALPGSPSALRTTVAGLADSYKALAVAAGARSTTRLEQAETRIATQEQQLSTQAGKL